MKIVLPSPEGEEAAIIATLRPGRLLRRAGPARWRASLGDGRRRSSRPRPSSCAASRFERLVDTDAGLRRALLAGLATELRRLTGHVEELHFLDLPGPARQPPRSDGA